MATGGACDMTSIKTIAFRPTTTDMALISAISEEKSFKTNADLIRAAIAHYAMVSLPGDKYESAIVAAFQDDNIF